MIAPPKTDESLYDSVVTYPPFGEANPVTASRPARRPVLRGIKNASYLALGNLVAQAVGLVGFAYIARVLGPRGYGTYLTVGAFVGMFDVFLLGGLNKVIIREGSQDVSSMHLPLEKTIAIRNLLSLVAIVLCIVSSFFAPYEVRTKLYIVLFSAQLAYTGLQAFLQTIYQATERMRYIAILSVVNRTLSVGLSIVFLSCGYGLLALFLILLGSDLFTTLATYRHSQSLVPFRFFSRIQFDKRLLKPALVFSLLGFMAFFASRIDLLMISFLGMAEQVGVYGVAYKIAQQGEMLRNVCAVAFFPILVKRFHERAIDSAALAQYSVLFFAGVLVLSVAAFFAVPVVIRVLFGHDYGESGVILRVLIFYLAFAWATLPFTSLLQATGNERYLILPTLTLGGLNIVFNYVLFVRYGLIGIAYSTLMVESIGCVLYCTVAYRVLRRQGHLV